MASVDVRRTYVDLRPAAEATLADEVGKALADSGLHVDVEQHVREGDAAATLVHLAHPGDLVVVGSRGHGVVVSALLGSTSHYVASHAPCPVVVVKEVRP
jgi:nucleotide-binding universal stress UspA family protein